MIAPLCDHCGLVPMECPCLLSREAWFSGRLPRTTIPSIGIVEVFKDRIKLRVKVTLELPEVGGAQEDRDRAWSAATAWQAAIRRRAGTSLDYYLRQLDSLREPGLLEIPYGYGSQAEHLNQAIARCGQEAVIAGETLRKPGQHVSALIDWLRPWLQGVSESESMASQVLSRLRRGECVPWEDEQGLTRPLNKDTVRNGLVAALKWMGAPEVDPTDPAEVERAWAEWGTVSALGAYHTRMGWYLSPVVEWMGAGTTMREPGEGEPGR